MKRPLQNKQPQEQHTCGECALGRWSEKHTNRDWQGKPFVKVCEHATWATNARGEHVALRSTRACDKYQPKTC